MNIKYGIKVPQTIEEVTTLDNKAGNPIVEINDGNGQAWSAISCFIVAWLTHTPAIGVSLI